MHNADSDKLSLLQKQWILCLYTIVFDCKDNVNSLWNKIIHVCFYGWMHDSGTSHNVWIHEELEDVIHSVSDLIQ